MNGIIIYWSGTGNTEAIANKLATDTGYEALAVGNASEVDLSDYDIVLFGCPAMGQEELEDDEFRPFYENAMASLAGKKIALFGSYGWGDGEWMRSWSEETSSLGGDVVATIISNGDDNDLDANEYSDFLSKVL